MMLLEPMKLVFFSNANSIHLKEWTEYCHHALGHSVTVFTVPEPRLAYEGVELVHIGNGVAWVSPMGRKHHPVSKVGWLTLLPRLRRELTRRRPDVLIAYRVASYGFLAALSGWRPLVIAAQSGNLVHPSNTWLARACVAFAVRRADLLHAWASNMRDELMRYGADPARIQTCSRGVDLQRFRERPARQKGPLRIVSTRSLQFSYNVRQLVEAMPSVLAEEPDAVCEVAGDGLQRRGLEDLARRLSVSHAMRFHGHVSRRRIVEFLEDAHVYVSTATTDGLSLSNIEAMAMGVYPVCSAIEANRQWIVNGANGALFPLHDPTTLAHEIIRAYRQPGLRAKAAVHNRKLVERTCDRAVNMKAMMDRYARLTIS